MTRQRDVAAVDVGCFTVKRRRELGSPGVRVLGPRTKTSNAKRSSQNAWINMGVVAALVFSAAQRQTLAVNPS